MTTQNPVTPASSLASAGWTQQQGCNSPMAASRAHSIAKVVTITRLGEPNQDAQYWRTLPYAARLAALEEIRQEYHRWKYAAQPGLQRVYSVIKR